MESVIYKRANTDKELQQILHLQQANHLASISSEEKQQEGFVTVKHDFNLLKKMNIKWPHVIAKHKETVIGYTLCMHQDFKNDVEVLMPMFIQIDEILKSKQTYIVMGQVCIDKNYRRQGIFKGLYHYMKDQLQSQFDLLITEVDVQNTRSLNAHYALGFKPLHFHNSNNQDWALIFWDWS